MNAPKEKRQKITVNEKGQQQAHPVNPRSDSLIVALATGMGPFRKPRWCLAE